MRHQLIFFRSYLCLQEGFTAVLKASLNGHLTVVQTLVEQYGGNVLHRKKVKCYYKLLSVSFVAKLLE